MSPLQEEILALKKKKNAVILAHNYQVREIQEVADYVGDSLGLAYQAQASKADIILFCGVHFMAETAKIVNPDKKVLLPDMDAGCSLAESCDAAELAAYKARHPGVYVVAYINCTAEVKALCDVICTSGNAERMVRHIPEDREILFVPDQNLGEWVMEKTGRKMRLWQGNCYIHIEFTHASITRIRRRISGRSTGRASRVHASPYVMLADEVCSTEKMVTYCRENPAKRLHHRDGIWACSIVLRRELPDKDVHSRPDRQVRLRRLPLYEDEHAGESLSKPCATKRPELIMAPDLREKALVPTATDARLEPELVFLKRVNCRMLLKTPDALAGERVAATQRG